MKKKKLPEGYPDWKRLARELKKKLYEATEKIFFPKEKTDGK